MKLNVNIEVKGNFKKQGNRFIYKNCNIISKRKGSTVEVKGNKIVILADVTGIDKVYFEIRKNKIRISDRFKDFSGNELNDEFLKFQQEKGYVPYPFTIFKRVRKAPPGLIIKILVNKNGKQKIVYEKSKELEIFNVNKDFNKKEFEGKLKKLFLRNFQGKGLVSSFSGGFDSLLLTKIYTKKCKHILHFNDNDKVDIAYYKKLFPHAKWTIIEDSQTFSESDRKKYFQTIDEPSCDNAGFAEYLIAKRIVEKKIKFPIMNGQGADGLFCSGRTFFQNYISAKLRHPLKYSNTQSQSFILSKLQNYRMNTKQRFYQYYLPDFQPNKESIEEFESIFNIYSEAIKNDSTNLYASLIVMLKYSLHGIEKIKTASRAFNEKYYLPFMSTDIVQYAFSIPARHKVGYKMGKRILVNSYPEIKRINFVSASFKPNQLKRAFLGTSNAQKYEKSFINSWIKYNFRKR